MASDIDAESHFEQQRRKAFFADVLAILKRRPNDLLSYEAARKALHANQQLPATIEVIPLDKIVGSVGRYKDFTRAFLPRTEAVGERWKRLDAALARLETIPPIEVYQLGDVYFVRDGNHRVSVARANGLTHIEAYVTRVESRVPLTAEAEVDSDGLEIIRGYTEFLEKTNLDHLRPQQRIYFSRPGRYRILLEHIAVHRYFMGLEQKREVPYEEAVTDWYDSLYEPIVAAIRREHILDEFPGRTEADLYLWIVDHHYYLSEKYGQGISPAQAAEHFVRHYGGTPVSRAIRNARRRAQDGLARLITRVANILPRWVTRPSVPEGTRDAMTGERPPSAGLSGTSGPGGRG